MEQVDPASFTVLRALDDNGNTLGVLVFSTWFAHPSHPEMWWAISAKGSVEKVVLVGDVDAAARKRGSELTGKGLSDLASTANQTGDQPARCAIEVLAALSVLGIGS